MDVNFLNQSASFDSKNGCEAECLATMTIF